MIDIPEEAVVGMTAPAEGRTSGDASAELGDDTTLSEELRDKLDSLRRQAFGRRCGRGHWINLYVKLRQ
jgi:hypothetical protein